MSVYSYNKLASKKYLVLHKKLRDKTVKELWEYYLKILKQKRPNIKYRESEKIAINEIDEFEEKVGKKFPKDFREVILLNAAIFSEFCFCFMPFEKMKGEWEAHNYILQNNNDDELIRLNENILSYPKKAIREACSNKYWIPFYEDYGGNFLAIDLDPDVEGRYGQIINFGRDEDDMFVVSEGIKEFLILMVYLRKYESLGRARMLFLDVLQLKLVRWLKKSVKNEKVERFNLIDECLLDGLKKINLSKKEK